jgi:cell division topological specificity factor
MGWLRTFVDWIDPPVIQAGSTEDADQKELMGARHDAKNRLKLVLMHDRTQLPETLLAQLRDEMVAVISKYVEIDNNAMEVNLETCESNTIALVANIPVLRSRT